MKATTLFTKEFTEIPPVQAKRRVEYQLLEDTEAGEYGIAVKVQEAGGERCDREMLSESKECVCNLLQLLYENAVTEESWMGVVDDLLPLLTPQP